MATTAAAVAVGGRARGECGSRGKEDVKRVKGQGGGGSGKESGDDGDNGSVDRGVATLDVMKHERRSLLR